MVFHNSASEHLVKLLRIVSRLDSQEMHVDDMDDFCKTSSAESRCATYLSGYGFFLGRNGWETKKARWTGQAPICDHVASGLVVGIPYSFVSFLALQPVALPEKY